MTCSINRALKMLRVGFRTLKISPSRQNRQISTSRPLTVDKRALVEEEGPHFLNRATVRHHEFLIDDVTSSGGGDKGPTPFVFVPEPPNFADIYEIIFNYF
jgi:hypothetical protein